MKPIQRFIGLVLSLGLVLAILVGINAIVAFDSDRSRTIQTTIFTISTFVLSAIYIIAIYNMWRVKQREEQNIAR